LQWYNWNPGGDQWTQDADPPLNDERWHATEGDPNSDVHSVESRGVNDPYFVSSGNSGNGDWFVWKGTWVDGTAATPEVSHQEYRFSFDHPAVTCDDDVKVPYCHWEKGNEYGNNSNGAASGLISGHMDHENDIWPAFDYKDKHYDAHGDQSILLNGCEVPKDTDVCSNLEGAQTSIPAGYHRGDNNTCLPDETTDLCLNIAGTQTSVPAGYVRNNDGTCTPPSPPPTDVCPNIPGLQASVPAGYQLIGGDCVQILGAQEIAPTVTFKNPTCANLDRAKWSGNLTDLVDYTVSGTPGRGNSITVTANIKPAVADEFAFPDGFDNTFDHSYPSKADLNCPTVKGSESSRPKPHKSPTVLGTQAVAPTAVDAGLVSLPGDSASSTTSLLAQLMVAGGLLLLLAGGWLGLGRREDGAHQA
jgi:hypothetical protein